MFRRTVRAFLAGTLSLSSVVLLAGAVPALADEAGESPPVEAPASDSSVPDAPPPSSDDTAPPDDDHAPGEGDAPEAGSEQTVTITDVAIAVADTGDNQVVEEATSDPAATDDTTDEGTATDGTTDEDAVDDPAVDTGAATAVGSQDTTTVSQQATAVLSGNATADITQIVYVFNIGLAGAASGGNTAGGASSGGEITTGSATAVGNSDTNYLTQAGSADATTVSSASTVQVSVTVSLGVAVANTGGNDVAGSASGSAVVATGTATAIGNDSTTDVSQSATAIGSDSATVVIGQQAVVVNIGVSLANSGFNGTADLAAALAGTGGDTNAAQQLFAQLLPALLATYADTGADSVHSGSATAVGNQSATYVSQTATAVASGDGTASVQQDVSVGNVGVAVANTGLNDSGAAMSPALLDAGSQALVSQLAGALATLFESVNSWSPGEPLPTLPGTLLLTDGTMNLAVDSSVSGTQTDIGSSDPAADGPHGTIRQIVAVFTIGVSSAQSGANTSVDVGVADDGSLVMAPGGSITTGDAVAVNDGTLIVCQRANEPNAICLGPPVESGPPVVEPPIAASSGGGLLPVTGGDSGVLLMLALGLVAAGAAMVLAGRRSVVR